MTAQETNNPLYREVGRACSEVLTAYLGKTLTNEDSLVITANIMEAARLELITPAALIAKLAVPKASGYRLIDNLGVEEGVAVPVRGATPKGLQAVYLEVDADLIVSEHTRLAGSKSMLIRDEILRRTAHE